MDSAFHHFRKLLGRRQEISARDSQLVGRPTSRKARGKPSCTRSVVLCFSNAIRARSGLHGVCVMEGHLRQIVIMSWRRGTYDEKSDNELSSAGSFVAVHVCSVQAPSGQNNQPKAVQVPNRRPRQTRITQVPNRRTAQA